MVDSSCCCICGECWCYCLVVVVFELDWSVVFNYGKCICCYCCVEVCFYGVLVVRMLKVGLLFEKLGLIW